MGRIIEAAGAVIVDDDGRVLLVRRGHAPSAGLWSVPGGRVEAGETVARAAVREVAEETGLAVEVAECLWTIEVPAAEPDTTYRIHDFAARVVGGELHSGDDAAEARWFAPWELSGLAVTDGLLGYLARAGIVAT